MKNSSALLADEVIGVHDDGVLSNAFPNGNVAGFFPIGVGQTGFGAGTVSVNDGAEVGVVGQIIGNNLTESFWEKAFINVFDGIMNIFFLGGNAALRVLI